MVKLYPDPGWQRTRRIVADAIVAAWSAAWLLAGIEIYRLVISLQRLADGITGAGRQIDGIISAFSSSIPPGIPLISSFFDQVSTSLEQSSGRPLIALGGQVHGDVATLAWVMAVAVAAPPLLIVTGLYLARRWRQAQELGAAHAFVTTAFADGSGAAATALLAYRAVTTLSFAQLMRASRDPVGDLVNGRHEALAAAQLAQLGLSRRLLAG